MVAEVAPLVAPGTSLGPFASADAAAIEMMHYSNPLSIQANLENGGLVFKDADGRFFVSTPLAGDLASFDPSLVPQPDGMASEGAYHGHADYTDASGNRTDKAGDVYNSDHFSEQDKRVADGGYWGPVIYVSTPSGDFRKYDSATRQDTVIQEGTRGRETQERPGVLAVVDVGGGVVALVQDEAGHLGGAVERFLVLTALEEREHRAEGLVGGVGLVGLVERPRDHAEEDDDDGDAGGDERAPVLLGHRDRRRVGVDDRVLPQLLAAADLLGGLEHRRHSGAWIGWRARRRAAVRSEGMLDGASR